MRRRKVSHTVQGLSIVPWIARSKRSRGEIARTHACSSETVKVEKLALKQLVAFTSLSFLIRCVASDALFGVRKSRPTSFQKLVWQSRGAVFSASLQRRYPFACRHPTTTAPNRLYHYPRVPLSSSAPPVPACSLIPPSNTRNCPQSVCRSPPPQNSRPRNSIVPSAPLHHHNGTCFFRFSSCRQ